MHKKEIFKLFQLYGGYMTSSQLVENNIHTSTIKSMVESREIDQVKRGLYRVPAEQLIEHEFFTFDYFDAAKAVPAGIFCLATALFYHGLTTFRPGIFDMAIPPTHRNTELATVTVRFYRFQQPYYSLDVQKITTETVTVKIYGKEKSVCDAIRLRRIIGEDIAMESLNAYIRSPNKDINKLFDTAEVCKVGRIVKPAVKAMIGF